MSECINKCSKGMLLHLNLCNRLTRSHLSKGENRNSIAAKNCTCKRSLNKQYVEKNVIRENKNNIQKNRLFVVQPAVGHQL